MAINIEDFNKGDRKAFNEVHSVYVRELNYFADNIIDDYEQAEEIVMDAFKGLFKRCARFKSETNIKAFLYISVKNGCLNYLKVKKRRSKLKKVNLNSNNNMLQSEIELNMDAMEISKRLREVIKLLPPTRRQVYELHYFDGLSNAEIAEKLNMNKGTVATHISEAKENLRQLL